jgi:hypothetical protein
MSSFKLNAYTKCTKCDTYYRELDWGCEICKPAKSSMVTPRGSDAINASRRALEILEQQMDDLQHEKKRQRMGDKPAVGRFDKALMKAELDCARTLSVLLEHVRKQVNKEAVAAEDLTPEERLDVFLDFIETLPPRLVPYLEAGLRARQLIQSEAPRNIFEDQ